MVEPVSGRTDPRRRLLLELFSAAIASVDGRHCTRSALARAAARPAAGRVWVAAVGKAAGAMALGAYDALGRAIERTLVITKDGHVDPRVLALPNIALSNIEIVESAHPVPDERSLAAGARLLEWVDALAPDAEPLFLISGGASSLVEALVPGATFAQLKELNSRGLASGLAIGELNAQRALISRIKGGRLVAQLAGRPGRALFISDVPGHDPNVIGSGIIGKSGVTDDRIERHIIASIDVATEAVFRGAEGLSLNPWRDTQAFDGPADRLAVRFTHELHMNPHQVRVWGGESVVKLPANPGRGGRNQHLALSAARVMAGHDNLLLLVAGTDGTDGVTEDAGALVDGETCSRVALAELDVQKCLENADSGTALAAAGDLIHTGPTGTNVGDLVIGLKLSRQAAAELLEARDSLASRML